MFLSSNLRTEFSRLTIFLCKLRRVYWSTPLENEILGERRVVRAMRGRAKPPAHLATLIETVESSGTEAYGVSVQRSHRAATASLGMRQSPRGDRLMLPTFGPSGTQERLNWLAKKRRMNTLSHPRSSRPL